MIWLKRDPDVISLGVGEPDFVTPEVILQAAQKSIDEGFTHYTSNDGMFLLREKISKYLKTKFGLEYKPETEMIITVGASEAVDVALTTLVSPGDEVLIPEPCFVSYGPCTQLCGGKAVFVPTSAENDFKLTVDQLEKYVTPKTRVLFISYPNNPTGAIMEKK